MDKLGFTDVEKIECVSFTEVFDNVERGRCDYGVVATENSLEGPVTACLDNFATHNNVTILAETVLDIHHSLVLHPDASIDEVTTIVRTLRGSDNAGATSLNIYPDAIRVRLRRQLLACAR